MVLASPDELLFGETEYQNRITVFYDVLGWRAQILEAGDDPRMVARLAALVRMMCAHVMAPAEREEGALLASFSDNVVFSVPYSPERLPWTLRSVAVIQFGVAMMGFWVRGGLTVGQLYHDEHIVFGPALNRAYEIESIQARYPRVVVDSAIDHALYDDQPFIAIEDDVRFVDPFTEALCEQFQSDVAPDPEIVDRWNELTGVNLPTQTVHLPGNLAMRAILERIELELRAAETQVVWEKHAWWFDRIAPRVGHEVMAEKQVPPPA